MPELYVKSSLSFGIIGLESIQAGYNELNLLFPLRSGNVHFPISRLQFWKVGEDGQKLKDGGMEEIKGAGLSSPFYSEIYPGS